MLNSLFPKRENGTNIFVCYVRDCDATGLSMNVLLKAIHDKMESNECTVKCDS